MTTTQPSGSTRAAQTLAFTVGNSGQQTPTASGYWANMQVWLCKTHTVDDTDPTTDTDRVDAGVMSSTGDNTAEVSVKVTAAQAANKGVVVKV